MPIGRRPPLTNSTSINILVLDGVAGVDISAGQAVAFSPAQEGQEVVLASASDAKNYVGFAKLGVSAGSRVVITTGRGSRVMPDVEGGVDLIPNQPVYLAATPGKVTQDLSTLSGSYLLEVGTAVSPTVMILKSDYAPKWAS